MFSVLIVVNGLKLILRILKLIGVNHVIRIIEKDTRPKKNVIEGSVDSTTNTIFAHYIRTFLKCQKLKRPIYTDEDLYTIWRCMGLVFFFLHLLFIKRTVHIAI